MVEASGERFGDELFWVTCVGSGCIKGLKERLESSWTEPVLGQSIDGSREDGRIVVV